MKSGLRGGKPRDMATFKKGAKVKKYADGGALRDKDTGDYLRDPLTGTRQYSSFGDFMKDLKREFGGKSEKAEAPRATSNRIQREDLPAPSPGAFDPVRQDAMDREEASRRRASAPVEDREIRRQDPARESLPTAQQARMRRRRAAGPESPPTDQAVTGRSRSRISRPMSEEEREAEQPDLSPRPRTPQNSQPQRTDPYAAERAASGNYILPGDVFDRIQTVFPRRDDLIDFQRRATKSTNYAKGGTVKKAGGGSCRGMGAAQRGGKYTIK